MKTAIVIALYFFSVSAFGVTTTISNDTSNNKTGKTTKAKATTEQIIKAFATGSFAIGMSQKQIEHAAKSMK
ncbi:hypothetical protein L4C38_11540 [Vibrio kasasachensis]|uniref:hypothetical protein n=1 Tax=Vibrio kasasachensis TaxID=2910248 RepID=UPI003D0E04E4